MLGIITANSSYAKIYSCEHKEIINSFTLLKELKHESSRKKLGEILSDNPNGKRHARETTQGVYTPEHTREEIEEQQFAKEITNALLTIKNQNSIDKFIISAEPHFFGVIRKTMEVHNLEITHYLLKDYTKIAEKDLKEKIKKTVYPLTTSH